MAGYTVYHERIESTHPALKRQVHHDSRSWDHRYDTTGLSIVSAVHERHIPILNQGQVGACTGNAGIGNLGTDPLYSPYCSAGLGRLSEHMSRTGMGGTLAAHLPYTLNESGALHLYSDAETIDGDGPYPPNDNGSCGLSIAKSLVRRGAIGGYKHTFSLEDALKAFGKAPGMLGVSWFDDMFNPDPDGRLHITGPLKGGHEIECREIDAEHERIWIDNSWGAWGVNGRAYLTFDDFGSLLKQRGDVTILTPLTLPTPTPSVEVSA